MWLEARAECLMSGRASQEPRGRVRGANPPLGEGTIRDVVMAPENDLFR